MKKAYLISFSVFAASLVSAQTNSYEELPKEKSTIFTDEQRPITFNMEDRVGGDIVWVDSFNVASDWTAAGPASDYEINGWSISDATGGWYFPNSGDMSTQGNFARFVNGDPNSDTEVENGPFTLEYNNVIDLTGIAAPQLEFEQYGARFVTLQAIEVSIDGGTNWIQVGNNDDIQAVTQDGGEVYGKPETRRFNITNAVAGDPSNVTVRLFWDGAMNGTSMNYVEYGWFVDNVRIVEGYDTDADIQASYFRSGVGLTTDLGLEYYMIPTSQVTPINFSAKVINQGALTHTGLKLTTTVDGPNAFSASSVTVDLVSEGEDSLALTDTYTPTTIGDYEVTFKFSGDTPEEYINNDSMITNFEVTEYTYARDNGNETGSISNVSDNDGLSMSIGNVMNIFANASIGALDIKISDDNGNTDKVMFGAIYKLNAAGDGYDWLAQSNDYTILNSDVDKFVRVSFESPVSVSAGDEILIVAGHYGDEVEFSYAQEADVQTVMGFLNDGSELFSLTGASVIMIRADMRDFTGVEEDLVNNISVAQNVPNPFNGNTVISYNLNEASNVTLQVVDLTGKVVTTINEGNQNAGEHNLTIDGSTLAEGTYFYTFTAGEYRVTKKMVVSK